MLAPDEAAGLWRRHRHKDRGRPKAVWDAETRSVVAFVYPGLASRAADAGGTQGEPDAAEPCAACAVEVGTEPTGDQDSSLLFARCLSGVFNTDLARCAHVRSTAELWGALLGTQFVRAIARFISFPTHEAARWLHVMDRSMSLVYEGKVVRHSILVADDVAALRASYGSHLAIIDPALSIESALLEEKWVRAVVDGERVVLLSTRNGKVIGMLSLSSIPDASEKDPPLTPHVSQIALQSLMATRDMALIASRHGDLYVQLGSGLVFHKSQGEWALVDYADIHLRMARHIDSALARHVLRMALDLSYERRGALLCILDAEIKPSQIALDFSAAERANAVLRRALRGMTITRWPERQVIAAGASTDGATLFDARGQVVDVACMVSPVDEETRSRAGFHVPVSFPGARATAAWNASFRGVAIHVSEDGPVSFWRDGRMFAAVG